MEDTVAKGSKAQLGKNIHKIAARIIEPDTGASTWALGSHK